MAGLVALGSAAISAWLGLQFTPALIPAVLFLASAAFFLLLAFRPVVEIQESQLMVGRRSIRWEDIRRVDHTTWWSLLVVQLTLSGDRQLRIVYPGDLDAANSLLRNLRRLARTALIDGVPYRRFWGEEEQATEPKQYASPKYHLLRPQDEEEVERLYQRLKAVGHLDPKNSTDEN